MCDFEVMKLDNAAEDARINQLLNDAGVGPDCRLISLSFRDVCWLWNALESDEFHNKSNPIQNPRARALCERFARATADWDEQPRVK